MASPNRDDLADLLAIRIGRAIADVLHEVLADLQPTPVSTADVAPTTARGAIPLWPDAGRRLGLQRTATYAAARRGDIPTLRLGRKVLVSEAALERLLAGEQVRKSESGSHSPTSLPPTPGGRWRAS